MTLSTTLAIVYQTCVLVLLLGCARLVQPPVPRPRLTHELRFMGIGLWSVTIVAFVAALFDPMADALLLAGIVVYTLSVSLRVWAILTLGPDFSYDLRIPSQRREVGPYRFLSHPAYMGSVGIFTSVGLLWGSWWASAILFAGTLALFGWRAFVEDRIFLSKVAHTRTVNHA